MGYCGNNFGISACVGDAALQRGSMSIRHMIEPQLANTALALSSRGAELCHTRQTQLWNRPMNITMFHAAFMPSLCSKRFGAICKAVTTGSMSSLRHLMMRGGVQILSSAAGYLSGSVSV